ncbi:MAG: flagellar biosynthetic protein FliO [Burkholderiaceae bacterium]
MNASTWTSALWFIAILALIPISLWLLKRSPVGAGASHGAGLRNVASLALSPSQRIVTLEVGHGDDRRWLVLGVTPSNISTLYSVAPFEPLPSDTSEPAGFALMLNRLRNGPATASGPSNGATHGPTNGSGLNGG